ncbi:hypothetical protein GQ43DRAFT_54353 [Delitschia confertaspora ATCC 74209]|uniref:Uncharacterized protein n=1 Tax=Delitschia confertaspora ATCC 74209 TaxID=1513339 RepID=A0A9P4JK65_9PLEO|nr:hypothetical protein GQ43DRAFT_54353 [Delitschia confertaspora ATCC 74209]
MFSEGGPRDNTAYSGAPSTLSTTPLLHRTSPHPPTPIFLHQEKFELIRARWEAAESINTKSTRPVTKMAGKSKHTTPKAHSGDQEDSTPQGSKFRRKINHGLSFISHPLGQRKTPGHQATARTPMQKSVTSSSLASLVTSNPSGPVSSPSQGSLERIIRFTGSPVKPLPRDTTAAPLTKIENNDETPKPLSRSRTMSNIPVPQGRSTSSAYSTLTKPRSPSFASNPQAHITPTAIPTPSPPNAHNSVSITPQDHPTGRSPSFAMNPQASVTPTAIPTPVPQGIPVPHGLFLREPSSSQKQLGHTTQQSKYIGAGRVFAGVGDGSPSKASVRPYTTPNLVKRGSYAPSGFMIPRKSTYQPRPPRSPTGQQATKKENSPPTNNNNSRKLSQIQDDITKRQSFIAPPNANARRSIGLNTLDQNNQGAETTPQQRDSRRSTKGSAQTPLTARRIQTNPPLLHQQSRGSSRTVGSHAITQTRLMGPRNPPTPPAPNNIGAPSQLPKSSIDRDFRRKTRYIATPSSSRAGSAFLRSSAALRAANREEVTEYMSPNWWAGRFQARFDQWRTEAMRAAADPDYKPDGILANCPVDQENVAACYIFLQLRDLCCNNEAADSLWEFEYKYRRDHQLLDSSLCNIKPLSMRRQDPEIPATPKENAFGRAIRKLTPRKSSMVNLLKGKGWGRGDEMKSPKEGDELGL